MRKILITGGAGFIGSNLCEYFLSKGDQVISLDNFSTGKKSNIYPFYNNPNFISIQGDIRDLDECKKAVSGVDYVLHHAAIGSVPRSIKDPSYSNEVNISGFLNMLIASRDAKVKRFIYASSSSTYGDSEKLPKDEENIGNQLSPYAITKYVNELYATIFSDIYKMQTIGLRYFNVFGRRQDRESTYAAVIPIFVDKLINHQSPVIFGDGNYTRDFTYIDNVIQINELAIMTENLNSVNNIYNAAVGGRTSLNQLIQYLKEYLSHYDREILNIKVKYGPPRLGDIPHSQANINKAKKLMGYSPEYSVQEGIKKTVEWYWNNLN